MWFDLSKHVHDCETWDFRWFGQFLTHDASICVANALVGSPSDYSNSLFKSLPKFTLSKLQYVQNCAARITCNTSRYTCILLSSRNCIVQCFKTAIAVCKFLHTGSPKY